MWWNWKLILTWFHSESARWPKLQKRTAGRDPESRCVYSPGIATATPLSAAGLVVPNSPQLFLICAPFTPSQLEAFTGLLLGLFGCRLLTHSCQWLHVRQYLALRLLLGYSCGQFSWQLPGEDKVTAAGWYGNLLSQWCCVCVESKRFLGTLICIFIQSSIKLGSPS